MISAGDFKNGITLEEPNTKTSLQEQFWRSLSVLLRNSRQHVLNVLICSISMMMVIYTTS